MTSEEALDVLVVVFAGASQALYACRRSGWYVYPATPVAFAIIWVALGWTGWRSVVSLGLVLLFVMIAMVIRLARRQPIVERTSTEPAKDFLLVWGTWGVCFVATIVIAVIWPP